MRDVLPGGGTEEELEKVDEDNIKCSVNLVNISVSTEGIYSQRLTVKLPNTVSGVWVSPESNVSIQVSVSNT